MNQSRLSLQAAARRAAVARDKRANAIRRAETAAAKAAGPLAVLASLRRFNARLTRNSYRYAAARARIAARFA